MEWDEQNWMEYVDWKHVNYGRTEEYGIMQYIHNEIKRNRKNRKESQELKDNRWTTTRNKIPVIDVNERTVASSEPLLTPASKNDLITEANMKGQEQIYEQIAQKENGWMT